MVIFDATHQNGEVILINCLTPFSTDVRNG